jgi:hypothetical protein
MPDQVTVRGSMDTVNERYGPLNRFRFFCILIICVLMMACLLWMSWRAMADANPWFTGIGIAVAVVYLASSFINSRRILRQGPGRFSRPAKPILRIVK